MKKKALLFIAMCTSLSAMANDVKYTPTEKEVELIKFMVKDDLEGFLKGGKSIFATFSDYTVVTSDEVLKTYTENEARADKYYKGKSLIVSGVVGGIKSGINDEPYIVFKAKNMFQAPQARFLESENDKVIELNKGNKVSLLCIGSGEVGGTPTFKDCLFEDTASKNLTDKYISEFDSLVKGDVDNASTYIREVAFNTNIFAKSTNDFEACSLGKMNRDCTNKLTKLKSKSSKDNLDQEMIKSLKAYLKLEN